jgi:hypothetical protein
MTHPTEEQLVDAYYAHPTSELTRHLETCSECAATYRNISETLDIVGDFPLTDRSTEYGAEVWSRLQPHLPSSQPRNYNWLLLPALAASLTVAFLSGMWIEQTRSQPALLITRQYPPPPQLPLPAAVPQAIAQHHRAHKPQPVSERDLDKQLLTLNTQLSENEPRTMPVLLKMITGDTPEKTKEHALFVLAQSDSPEAHKELTGLYVSSPTPNLKYKILNSVFLTGDANTLSNILKSEKDLTLKVSAISTLGAMPGRSITLTNLYHSDTSAEVRNAVLDALAKQHETRALSDLARQEIDLRWKAEIMNHLYKLQSP